MSSETVKLKRNMRGLDIIQAVYAFAMAGGLTQVYRGSQAFLTGILSGTDPLANEKTLLIGPMTSSSMGCAPRRTSVTRMA